MSGLPVFDRRFYTFQAGLFVPHTGVRYLRPLCLCGNQIIHFKTGFLWPHSGAISLRPVTSIYLAPALTFASLQYTSLLVIWQFLCRAVPWCPPFLMPCPPACRPSPQKKSCAGLDHSFPDLR